LSRYLAIVILTCFPSFALAWEENPGLAEIFERAQTAGTFVVYDVTENAWSGYNHPRAETRYIPASTFKIANSLIGLSCGAVSSVDEVLPYKGPAKPMVPKWAHDMGLREAIAMSNVPIYQELSRRIGPARMREGVAKLHYGNGEIGAVIDKFWLDGPLEISAFEQVTFLTGLVQDALPLPKKVQASVREILLLETGTDWKLYGKTGWQNAPGRGIGWFVGWVEKKGRYYVFALNIDIKKPDDAAKRTALAKASLQRLGLL